MTQITEHFTLEEFSCHDGSAYPPEWVPDRVTPLCQLLEVVRDASGGPLTIDSGYRTLAYDQKLYDASAHNGSVAPPTSSQHPMGRAADIKSAVLAPHDMFNLVLSLYEAGKLPNLGGVGLYPTFVHVDIRPKPTNGHLAIWGGARPSNVV